MKTMYADKRYGLIETWDVLKWKNAELWQELMTINRNMGCIEIARQFHAFTALSRLIETWDVLKSSLVYHCVFSARD